jgi:hypothetical protein
MTDWRQIRGVRFSTERPLEWPENVYAISMQGLALLGVHEETNKLYWDGKEIVTRNLIRLGTYERWAAGFAAAGTFGSFLVNVGRANGWWL